MLSSGGGNPVARETSAGSVGEGVSAATTAATAAATTAATAAMAAATAAAAAISARFGSTGGVDVAAAPPAVAPSMPTPVATTSIAEVMATAQATAARLSAGYAARLKMDEAIGATSILPIAPVAEARAEAVQPKATPAPALDRSPACSGDPTAPSPTRARHAADPQPAVSFSSLSGDELSHILRVAGQSANGWFIAAALACTCTDLRDSVATWCAHYVAELAFIGVGGLDDQLLSRIGRTCASNLRSINVSKNGWITDASICDLIRGAPKLSHLTLSTCQHVKDPTLHTLAASKCATLLRTLDVSSCRWVSDEGIAAVAKACVSLTHLDISFCRHALTASCLHAVGTSLPSLRFLGLRAASKAEAVGIMDEAIGHVANGCPLLTTLYITRCGHLTDAAAISLAVGCPNLERLDVGDVSQIGDDGMRALAGRCARLIQLDARSLALSPSTVIALAKGCPQLHHISLDHSQRLDASAWTAIAAGCPHLAFLSAVNAAGIDDDVVRALAIGCPGLRTLRLGPAGRHPFLSKEGVSELCVARPLLEVEGGPCPPPSTKRRR